MRVRRARPLVALHRAAMWIAILSVTLAAGCAVLPPSASEPAATLEATPPAQAPAAHIVPSAAASVALPPALRFRLDPGQDAERGDLWQRLRGGFALPDLEGDLVLKWEQFYAGKPDYVERMTARGSRYLFHILEEVDKRHMPAELALLPFIESAFNPQAMSRASASGMWQFMPATGKDFELRQNVFRDDRRGVLASTRAALDYLKRLHAQFGDWQLALAAYNWGQGNVQKALASNQRAGLPADYASLRMPDETRNYLPKLQAMKNIVLRPESFALVLPRLENHPFFLTVAVDRDIDVTLAARLAGLTLDEFQQLNPQMNKPVILAAGTPHLLLPYDNANRFVRELALHQGALASWTAWVAPRTLKPEEAAQLVGMPEARLREVNLIPPRMLVKVGSTLLVPRGPQATADVPELLADHASMSLSPEARPPRRVSFKAGRQGDSVAAVAKRYHIGATEVARWNKVGPDARFKPGTAIVVMLPTATATAAAKAVTPRRKAHAQPAARVAAR